VKFYLCTGDDSASDEGYFIIIVEAKSRAVAIKRAEKHLREGLKISACRLLAIDNYMLYSTVEL